MSLKELPARPNLEFLRKQAKTLLDEALSSDPSATARFQAFGIQSPSPKLADALHVTAREYGFDTWPALKSHIEVATSENPLEALAAAIKSNTAPLVRDVLTRHRFLYSDLDNPLPNISFDMPAIVVAAQKANRDILDALLEAGANINARTHWWAGGFGVLDLAPLHLTEYLISRGAHIDIHAAARLGKIDRIREFLTADPSLVHARGGDGQLPLHFAATVEIAALLLDHGADIDARDIDHESTAAQYMVSMAPHRHDVARFLISRGAQADILMAAALGDLALVEKVLNHDPDTVRYTVSERNFPRTDPKSGGSIYIYGFGLTKSPHMIAHQFGHPAVFDLLMQRSAPWLRLIQAAEIGDFALSEQILQQHPTLIARLSPAAARRIIGAAARNNTAAVKFLLERGWPANPALDNNQTSLHFAAWQGNLEMVRILLAHNAPVNVFEKEHGGSPLAWALYGSLHSGMQDADYPGVAKALLAAGAAVPKPERPLEAREDVMEIIRSALNS
jgi:ankyrin repeat protein